MLLALSATHAAVLVVLLLGLPEPTQGSPSEPTPSPPPRPFAIFSYPDSCQPDIIDPIDQIEWDVMVVGKIFTVTTATGCWRREKLSSTILDDAPLDGGPNCGDLIEQTLEYYWAPSCSRAGDDSESSVGVPGGTRALGGPAGGRRHLLGEQGAAVPVKPRLLDGALPVKPGDTAYDNFVAMCANVDYEGSLVIEDDHFYVFGSPKKNDASPDSCPYVASHAVFRGPEVEASDALYVKEVLLWDTNENEYLKKVLQDSLHLGTYKLSLLERAHDSIDPSKRSGNHKFYDVINFNCVDFVMAFASALNVEIDSKVTSYVARRLLEESGKKLVDEIRQSSSFLTLFPGRNLRADSAEHVTDEQVVYALVDKHASDGLLG